MFLHDAVAASKPRRTADGYLVADVKVARTGVQEYLGSELGRPDMPIVRVYRPESEVFDEAAMRSYTHRPMTNNHPAKPVTADTWKAVAIGQTGDKVVRDGEFVTVPLVLMDAASIKAYESGKRELSMGYTAEIIFDAGTTPSGEPYDAVQTQLRMNHLALVDRARGGASLRIGDRNPNPEDSSMSNANTKTVLVDGLQVETTDAGAQAITKLQGQIQDAAAASQRLVTDHATAIAAKDTEIGALKVELQQAKDAAPKPADLDRMVADRVALVTVARAIAPAVKVEGVSDADIRTAVVAAKLGAEFVKDASPGEVLGMFRAIAKDAKPVDPVRGVLRDGLQNTQVTDNGYAESVRALQQGPAYKPATNGSAA